jgi:hypothetical protein
MASNNRLNPVLRSRTMRIARRIIAARGSIEKVKNAQSTETPRSNQLVFQFLILQICQIDTAKAAHH